MNLISLLIITVVFFMVNSFIKKNFNSKDKLIGPWELPILGSLLYFGNRSDKYGDFKMYMGDYRTVVLADPMKIREVWVKNFDKFSDRPHLPTYEFFTCGFHDVSTADYSLWKNNRGIIANSFSKINLKVITPIIENQCKLLLKRMKEYQDSNEIFYPKNHLKKFSMNVMLKMVFSTEIPYDETVSCRTSEELGEPLNRVFETTGTGNLFDYIKSLHPLSMLYLKYSVGDDLNYIRSYIYELYQDHLLEIDTKKVRINIKSNFPRDLFDIIISADYPHDKENNIIGIGSDLIGVGTDTSSSSLTWFFLYMCNYPKVQEKAFRELQEVIGQDRQPHISDRINTPYVAALIKEILRIRPIAPLGVPRLCGEDFTIGDIHINQGDLVLMNIFAIHHNEKYWKDPKVFEPERFIDNNNAENWIPFGLGPRNCLGIKFFKVNRITNIECYKLLQYSMALDEIYLAITNILLNYKITSANGQLVDDTERKSVYPI
ncbi:cytochrome P450 family protein [Heterostelium album PN500]|uniref:Cytochrome P450 family protein n=1 Tax=Heterostelium pallidum (strain ATCC 26659 / Pp 5 / PN500) TaxID=670386 RepID=D3BVQ0_HETP5|nr:cytochrome P450 family protein [Heterostelium album PN500]EFA74553.1 cytochrome P450 family protein [Heterostelium album PN500]|eukprot:XP_020426687.1 cytochrome P450 family protein [Heterostelium album PN500]